MDFIFNIVVNNLKIIEYIVFWYPVTMGLYWVIGSIIYYFRIEIKRPLPLFSTPKVSILVPAYNEQDQIELTIDKLLEIDYPDFEILLINDGSKDKTPEILERCAMKDDKIRFINLKENAGKANALWLGLMASKGEYLVCVDGDSYLDKDCLRYMIPHFVNPNVGERVGAVTGNPRIRNRSSLLAKIQLSEYASIISLIKRTQRMWGKVMTVSGVVVAYRKRALLDCGLWDRDIITEDIGVTWKLEKNYWDIRYEPRAICWMLVPETIVGLFKQRKRWAQGGLEVMIRHADIFMNWRKRRLFPVYLEQVFSIIWVILWIILTFVELIKFSFGMESYLTYIWKSQYLSIVCMIQFFVAILLEKKYDKKMLRNFLTAAWYPLIYWVVSGVVSLFALPSAYQIRKGSKLARWESPDRGIHTSDDPEENANLIHRERDDNVALAAKIETDRIKDDLTPDKTDKTVKTKKREHIIRGKQIWWKRIIEVFFTMLAWVYILVFLGYVTYGFISMNLGVSFYQNKIYNLAMLLETKQLLYITGIVILIEIAFLIIWKEYNLRKYGKLRRRKFKKDVSNSELALYFQKDFFEIQQLQEQKIIVLEKNIIPDDFKPEPVEFEQRAGTSRTFWRSRKSR